MTKGCAGTSWKRSESPSRCYVDGADNRGGVPSDVDRIERQNINNMLEHFCQLLHEGGLTTSDLGGNACVVAQHRYHETEYEVQSLRDTIAKNLCSITNARGVK